MIAHIRQGAWLTLDLHASPFLLSLYARGADGTKEAREDAR